MLPNLSVCIFCVIVSTALCMYLGVSGALNVAFSIVPPLRARLGFSSICLHAAAAATTIQRSN